MNEVHLYKRPSSYLGIEPFEGDLFDRETLADRLTNYINRLTDGCVISIDANWGEGKSWFGRNWQAKLAKENYATVYLDAFENDFADDAFLVIASELFAIVNLRADQSVSSTFIEKAKIVGKNILPIGVKAAISVASKLVFNEKATEELKKVLDSVSEDFGKAAETYIEKRLQDQDLTRKSVQDFRVMVAEFCTRQDKPVVFFIDELDRCRPTFAVQVIERIKHFFDVQNLIFVLLLNRSQLESATKGVYGESIDANAYLSKFVHFSLTLPKRVGPDAGVRDYNRTYLRELASRHAYSDSEPTQNFVDTLAHLARWLGLSFRDLERCILLYGLAQPVGTTAAFVAYFIALKVGRPMIFAQLAKGSKDGHAAALAFLNRPEVETDISIVPILKALHEAHINDFEGLSEGTDKYLALLRQLGAIGPSRLVQWIIKKIDVQITD